MAGRIKSAGLVAAFLVIFFPFLTLAEAVNFSIIPAEVHIDKLTPGEVADFELAIHNKDDLAHNFTIATFPPPGKERRAGTTEFPDDSWISFSSPRIEIAANSQANVTVTVAIPQEPKWAGEDWETWLGITAESSDLLGLRLHVRLLVSTDPATEPMSNIGLFIGIAVVIVLLSYGGYHYFRQRAKPR
jgi:hypothetical protein